jgi:fructose-bisphosphate aldolase, class II
MPVANYKTYCKMLDRARARRFAFPAINVTSLTTANAVLRGLAESKSDGIIQISTGGGAFAYGLAQPARMSALPRTQRYVRISLAGEVS